MKSWENQDIAGGISATISDHSDRNWRNFPSNINPVRSNLVHDVVSFWCWQCANFKCALGYLDIWNCVESYAIWMLLACRLKIIPTSNLNLIISFLVLLILVLSFFKSLLVVASKQPTHLTLHTVLRLANRPSAQFWNSSKQGQSPSDGDLIYLFLSQGRVLVLRVSRRGAYLEPRWHCFFSATPCSTQESRKFLPAVYLRGINFSGSSA